ncbi:COL6A [Acanthosepion pharaonis]|uniref:COL6A n=1 Tax=Acanthosepion pharaonis TaxID=158019 RepID=A0A812CP79_ACAPH|nr:COL6A [Sepia pharaonis]
MMARPQLIYRCTRTVADVVFVLDNSGSVGKGNFLRRSELRAIASYPKYKHMFTVGNFNALKTITRGITKNICQVARPQLIYRCKHAVADVVFVLDNSGSVGKGNFPARPQLIYRCKYAVADVAFVLDNSGSVGKGNFHNNINVVVDYLSFNNNSSLSLFLILSILILVIYHSIT